MFLETVSSGAVGTISVASTAVARATGPLPPARGVDSAGPVSDPATSRLPGHEIGRMPVSASDVSGTRRDFMVMGAEGVCTDTYQAWNPARITITVDIADWSVPATWDSLRATARLLYEQLVAHPEMFEPPNVSIWTIQVRPTAEPLRIPPPVEAIVRSREFYRAVSGALDPVVAAASQLREAIAVKKVGTEQDQYLLVIPLESRVPLASQLYALYQVKADLIELSKRVAAIEPTITLEINHAIELVRRRPQTDESPAALIAFLDKLMHAQHDLVDGSDSLLTFSRVERSIDSYRGGSLQRLFRVHGSPLTSLSERTVDQEEEEILESHYLAPVRRRTRSLEEDMSRVQLLVSARVNTFRGQVDLRLQQRLVQIQWTLIALAVVGTIVGFLSLFGSKL